jgi:hypothetical protein
MRSICLLQQLLGAKVCGAKYRKANDPETEIWRACQRSITAVDGRRLLLAARLTGVSPVASGRAPASGRGSAKRVRY